VLTNGHDVDALCPLSNIGEFLELWLGLIEFTRVMVTLCVRIRVRVGMPIPEFRND